MRGVLRFLSNTETIIVFFIFGTSLVSVPTNGVKVLFRHTKTLHWKRMVYFLILLFLSVRRYFQLLELLF